MQWGSLAAVPVSAIVTWRSGRRGAAVRLGVAGLGAWLVAKPVKRAVGRERPGAYMDAVNIRGSEQRGLGFPSGHAAVSAAMAIAVAPDVGNAGRAAALASAVVVAMSRVYIGSHFPFDALAGTLLGGAVGLAVRGLEPTRLPGVSSRR
jgi:undecaprenyl-diphosphatase